MLEEDLVAAEAKFTSERKRATLVVKDQSRPA